LEQIKKKGEEIHGKKKRDATSITNGFWIRS
jgi:hypothetical protein